MKKLELINLRKLLRIRKAVQPKTYLDELAENGMLDYYLNNFFKNKINTDVEFKEKIYDSYYNYSKDISENLEVYYLEEMCKSLSFFIEMTHNDRNSINKT